MPSSYAVGPHFEDLIQRLLASGRYANASEVVRAGLRLLEEHEEERERRRAAILQSLDEAGADLDAGRGLPAEAVLAEIEDVLQRARRDAAE